MRREQEHAPEPTTTHIPKPRRSKNDPKPCVASRNTHHNPPEPTSQNHYAAKMLRNLASRVRYMRHNPPQPTSPCTSTSIPKPRRSKNDPKPCVASRIHVLEPTRTHIPKSRRRKNAPKPCVASRNTHQNPPQPTSQNHDAAKMTRNLASRAGTPTSTSRTYIPMHQYLHSKTTTQPRRNHDAAKMTRNLASRAGHMH